MNRLLLWKVDYFAVFRSKYLSSWIVALVPLEGKEGSLFFPLPCKQRVFQTLQQSILQKQTIYLSKWVYLVRMSCHCFLHNEFPSPFQRYHFLGLLLKVLSLLACLSEPSLPQWHDKGEILLSLTSTRQLRKTLSLPGIKHVSFPNSIKMIVYKQILNWKAFKVHNMAICTRSTSVIFLGLVDLYTYQILSN